MREIKFRGLNQDGAWLYGSYVTDYKDFHAIMTQHPFEPERMLQTPIHKETVGQFTGLHSKNGREIYEGILFA